MLDVKLILVDDDVKLLKNVDSPDSDSEVEERETKVDDDFYDDDLYDGHDMFENLQAIYDDWDIKVHGPKKK
ncbi:hypothetical protein Tco_0517819 [Tanacetum coccineum]